jgi:hypothetical protein
LNEIYRFPNWDNKGNDQVFIRHASGSWLDCFNEKYVPESHVIKVIQDHCLHESKVDTSFGKAICNDCGKELSTLCNHLLADMTPEDPHNFDIRCVRCNMPEVEVKRERHYLKLLKETNEQIKS